MSPVIPTSYQPLPPNLTISGILLFVVFLMCPLVVYFVQALTSDIQMYAQTLVNKTKELHREMRKTNSLLYQMVPRVIADKLKNNESIDAEYFKSTTIMSSEIVGFTDVTIQYTPREIVELLNILYTAFDEQMVKYDVYRVETITDAYTIVSGLPVQIDNKHSAEIGHLALDFLEIANKKQLFTINDRHVQVKIGINTGSCMAGVVGSEMPRYNIFGDSVKTASRMKITGLGGKIHLSAKAFNSMKNHKIFIMTERGQIQVKKKGVVNTYWLEGRHKTPVDEPDPTVSATCTNTHNIVGAITECSEVGSSPNPVPSTSFQTSGQEHIFSNRRVSGTKVAHGNALQHEEEIHSPESSDKATPFCPQNGRGRPGEDKQCGGFGKQHERATSSQTAGSHELPGEILECYATDPQSTINIHNSEIRSYVRGKDYSEP
ncbi:guanylate cyclase 32E-like [Gigantopelta aegis]|uniref:guanylate cyclase 32E-like n=1 Tax=Gigantopelta aegis TaxID=1735272 RepID=UPI001B88C2C6|nr:guanylate cyclase 32E-like [Gigantopelta aegis]